MQKIESLYKSLCSHVQDILFRMNSEGKIIFISPSCENEFGYTQDELNDKQLSVIFWFTHEFILFQKKIEKENVLH